MGVGAEVRGEPQRQVGEGRVGRSREGGRIRFGGGRRRGRKRRKRGFGRGGGLQTPKGAHLPPSPLSSFQKGAFCGSSLFFLFLSLPGTGKQSLPGARTGNTPLFLLLHHKHYFLSLYLFEVNYRSCCPLSARMKQKALRSVSERARSCAPARFYERNRKRREERAKEGFSEAQQFPLSPSFLSEIVAASFSFFSLPRGERSRSV